MDKRTLLIIEDGDEYLRFFSRHLNQYTYLQAHSHLECVEILEHRRLPVEGIVLDIRFDRVPRAHLIGNVEEIAERMFGDISEQEAAWQYVIDNQGYLILRDLRDSGFEQPALLIADLPPRQRTNLGRIYGEVGVVDSFDRSAIQRELSRLLTQS